MKTDLQTRPIVGRLRRVLPWLWLLGCFAVLNLFLAKYMTQLLDSDLAAELMLSRQLVDYGNIMLNTEWIYSTEIKALSTQLIYSNVARLFTGWHTVRVIGNALIYLVMLLCFYYFCRQAGLKKQYPLLAGCLMLPFSDDYFLFVLRGAYYAPYICISFLLFGMVIKIVRGRSRPRWLTPVLMLLLSFSAGAAGLRQVLVFNIPAVLAGLVLVYLSVKDELRELSESLSLKGLGALYRDDPSLRFFAVSLLSFVFSVLGLVFNSKILSRYYWFRSYNSLVDWIFPGFEQLSNTTNGWLAALGFRVGKSLFSGATVCNALSVILLLIIIVCSVRAVKRFKSWSFENAAIVIFNASAVVVYTLLFWFTDLFYNNRYNLPIVVFVIPVLAVYISTVDLSARWKRAGSLGLCAIFLVLGLRSYTYYDDNDTVSAFEKIKISEYLTDNGYSNGYASFWNANVLTEMSEGQLELWCLEDEATDLSQIKWWLQKLEHTETIPDGRLFFVTTAYERSGDQVYSFLEDEHLVFTTENYFVYSYDSYDALPEEMKPQPAESDLQP